MLTFLKPPFQLCRYYFRGQKTSLGREIAMLNWFLPMVRIQNILDQYLQDNEDKDEIEDVDLGVREPEQRKNLLKRKREMHVTTAVRTGTPPELAR